jgi:phosphate transport system permease protein
MTLDHSEDFHPQRLARRIAGPVFSLLCLVATFFACAVLAVLLGSVVTTALGHQTARPWYAIFENLRDLFLFLGGLMQKPQEITPEQSGFRVGVVSSLWLLGMVALFAIPIGVAAATYLEEYAADGPLKSIIQTNIANLSGVPSIVYGILGLTLFVRGFGNPNLALGFNLKAGALTLGLLVLPTIVIATQEALRAIPITLRHAALALGATRWSVIRDHVLPAALPGILTGVILALSRAIGETAPVLMVIRATSLLTPPRSPNDDYVPLPVEIYNYATEPIGNGFERVAAGGILLLLTLLLSMNAIAIFIRNRYSSRHW